MKKLYIYGMGIIIALMPIIMLIMYVTHTEKIIAPVIIIMAIILRIVIRKEK